MVKQVWCSQTAADAYMDTIKHCSDGKETGVAELISAMAAGWSSRLIVETWVKDGPVMVSIGLEMARRQTGGRHICFVVDERSKTEYTAAMAEAGVSPPEVVVGDGVAAIVALEGVDFLVVDCRRGDFGVMVETAALSRRGAVVVCKNARGVVVGGGFRWRYLPVGKGLEISQVVGEGGRREGKRRWVMHVDGESGEVHLIRR